ncbi:phage portal protein [Demequina globuliformis]|uniref:phage portal protein n=1 Tax=Demequina globuliformis TaxID=676202 RepID=UPI0007864536|nr:phage portal protein [Demequina globuliformis]
MARLTTEDQAIFDRLKGDLVAVRSHLDLLDRYYDGMQRFDQLGLAIPPEVQNFRVIVNWPRVVADAIADRLDVKGFRLPGNDTGDADLWRTWQANDMDEQDIIARLDYQVYGRSFHCVGANEREGEPLITVESPRQVITDRDPRTRKVTAALRLYKGTPDSQSDDRATLYLPNVTYWLSLDGGIWEIVSKNDHNLGRVPVVPSFRGRRSTIPAGRTYQGVSAMADVIPVTDAAARNITNVQVAQETHAVPARWVAGVSKNDFADENGKPLPVWESYFGVINAATNSDTKFGQYASSDMRNFDTMQTLYARQASAVTGLPPNYFGLSSDDAASADAIRSREARLVKRAERDQVVLGNAREEAMRIAMQIKTGKRDPELEAMECLWYDAGTPTYASRADAVVKMWAASDQSGRGLLPTEMAYEELGWSPQKVTRALALREAENTDPYLSRLSDKD